MPNRMILLGAATLALVGSTLTGTAHAADLDLPYLQAQSYSEDKVEFGSGWYIRGDLAATRLPSVGTSAPNLLTNGQAAALVNAGGNPQLVNDQASASSLNIGNGSTLGYTASIGAGYKVTPWFRGDIVADFHKPIVARTNTKDIFCQTGVAYPNKTTTTNVTTTTTTIDPNTNVLTQNVTTVPTTTTGPDYSGNGTPSTGNCTGSFTAKLSSYDVLVNGYIDLGTWYHVTPYIGAGLGVSFGHYQTTSTFVQGNQVPYHITYNDPKFNSTNSPNFDRSSSGTYYNFAYALMAGAAIDIYDHTKLDIGYRYLNLGKIDGVSGTLYSHEVRAGVRYMIDD